MVLRSRWHRITRENILDFVTKEAHEALFSLRIFTLPFIDTMRLLDKGVQNHSFDNERQRIDQISEMYADKSNWKIAEDLRDQV